jgi:hypothetical protein
MSWFSGRRAEPFSCILFQAKPLKAYAYVDFVSPLLTSSLPYFSLHRVFGFDHHLLTSAVSCLYPHMYRELFQSFAVTVDIHVTAQKVLVTQRCTLSCPVAHEHGRQT